MLNNFAFGMPPVKAAGIDLAGAESRDTGFCIMDSDLSFTASILHEDREILMATLHSGASTVAIDAPLALPRGRESLDKRSDIHFRECDRELLRLRIKFFPLTLGPMRQLTKRGMRLKEALEKEGMTVIETYPGATQDILGIPRKGRGIDKLAEGLRLAGISGVKDYMTGDELDAVSCALAGIMYLKGEYSAIGDPGEMLMILPPLPQDWADRKSPKHKRA